MKDEYGATAICEYTGTKSKMYSIRDVNNYESVHKGHNSNIKYDEFKNTLFNKKVIRHNMKGIKPFNIECILLEVIKYLYLLLMTSVIFLMME